MNKKAKEIFEKLPSSWSELKVSEYQKLTEIKITESDEFDNLFVGVDNSLKVVSVLTDVPIKELEAMPIADVTQFCNKISFMDKLPVPNKKSNIKWKKPSEITYGDFVIFQQFEKDLGKNVELIIPAFSKNKMSPEEVLDMNVQDMHTAFFLLGRGVQKSLRSMIFYSKVDQKNQQIAEWIWKKMGFKRK